MTMAALRWMLAPTRGGAAILLLIAAILLIAGYFSPWQPQTIDWSVHAPSPPDYARAHWLGTDALGRDAFVRLLHASAVSLLIGVAAASLSVALGALVGVIAGLAGGRTQRWLMRGVDVAFGLPQVFMLLLIAMVIGRGPLAVVVGLTVTGWLACARLMHVEASKLAERPFMEAARSMGLSLSARIYRHALPNLTTPLAVCFTLAVPQCVLSEGFISFLGLGVQEPQASLGNLLAQAVSEMERAPWLLMGPTLTLIFLVLLLNTLADRLQKSTSR